MIGFEVTCKIGNNMQATTVINQNLKIYYVESLRDQY